MPKKMANKILHMAAEDLGKGSQEFFYCQLIMEFLLGAGEANTRHLTIKSIGRAIGRENPEDTFFEFKKALVYLAGERANALEIEYELFLSSDDEDPYPIPLEEITQAAYDGFLVNPQTGEQLPDYKKLVRPFFRSNPVLFEE